MKKILVLVCMVLFLGTLVSAEYLEACPYEAYDFFDLSGRDWNRQHSGRALPVRSVK